MKKRLLSMLLVLAMLLSLTPAAGAADVQTGIATEGTVPEISTDSALRLPVDNVIETDTPSGVATGVELSENEGKFANHEITPFSETAAAQQYEATDVVDFIVVMKGNSLLAAGYSADEIAAQTASVMGYQGKQLSALDTLKAKLTSRFGDSENFKINFTYTVATTGISVTTEYGNKAAIEAISGVEKVYVAPTFNLPEDQVSGDTASPYTSNSTTMIGSDLLNATGYTGVGMRIAILDTGLLVSHPNFQPLPEEKLEDPLTREEIENVWDNLNASETILLCNAYLNTKVPYVFNYVALDYNVDHSYAGHDHGTHVAGIAAANKIEGSDVIGVAPDAQILVMQVFQKGGGAAWSHIMAALEDCIWLNVDTANLSLGSAAGFTSDDADDEFNRILSLFSDTGIEVLIASGNDTNNAYMNLTGLNMALAGNPDIGLAGTPSTYKAALAAASIDNDGRKMPYFTVAGKNIGFVDSSLTSATNFLSNFKGQTLEYVLVPGVGAEEDYTGLDVAGKVAVVSRGTTSFPEKQSVAQAHGAIACIVYNNTSGFINMQINDGEGHIPAIFISQADGQHLQAQSDRFLTVGTGETTTFKVERTVSDFSSWGVTPDLKLKPEIAGVGGQVYSTTDPQISGSYYSTWNGTSMATPQVAGASAIMLEYMQENYDYEGAELRRMVANLMMSTAQVVMDGDVEYTPRAQGAGLVDLVAATTSGAVLSSSDTYENRPKGEMGDDPERTGAFSFNFEITNFSDEALTYTLDSSVITETLYADAFIANAATALESKVVFYGATYTDVMKYDFNDDGEITTADARALLRDINNVEAVNENHQSFRDVNGDGSVNKDDVDIITAYCAGLDVEVDLLAMGIITGEEALTEVTVPAGETLPLVARINLTDADKEYLELFPNGIYVEGFVYVNSADEGGVDLNLPFVGFYGDWSDAPIFDSADEAEATLYPAYVFTNYSLLGENPYIRNGKSGAQYNAFSYGNPLAEIDFGQHRNAKRMTFTVTDKETEEVYWQLEGSDITKSYYNSSYGIIFPTYVQSYYGEVWDGLDANGNALPDGTAVTYSITGWLDDGDDLADDEFSFDLTLDSQMPEIENEGTLQESLSFEAERTYLTLNLRDNAYIAALIFVSPENVIMGKYEVDNTPGETFTGKYDITGFGSEFSIIVADYACNENEIDVILNLGDHNLDIPTPIKLDNGRLYGCETFDSAMVEAGWFSANKTDFSDPRNETFDSSNRYYAAEYVNGYLVAQNAITGNLELVTPGGTYWSVQTLCENSGSIGQSGYWVFYDMAMDYSGETDRLYAVGWAYKGDNDNNGKDDGYNALFEIKFSTEPYSAAVSVNEVGRIVGTDGAEVLTLGITTEGNAYGIDTAGRFYQINTEPVWDSTIGTWGDYAIATTYIATTDFVNVANYSGVNVIQSMGYDHNTGIMYWYAHSQTANGSSYLNINTTYTIDLATGKCTEIGTYGAGGQTCLFVPHNIQSDLFEMGVQATNLAISPISMTMVEGQTSRLRVSWTPWNALPSEVTWSTSDDSFATVDAYGFVTAHKQGNVTISAAAEVELAGYWDWDENGEWSYFEGGLQVVTVSCEIKIVPSEDALYSFIIADFKDFSAVNKWMTYSDKSPTVTTNLGSQKVEVMNPETGELTEEDALWYGGAYYNGYVYTVSSTTVADETGAYTAASALYRSKVTKGNTPEETVFGTPELIGYAPNVELSAMAFDYNTSRMYAVENKYLCGLGIIDLETGEFDYLGTYNGDLVGPTYTPAMCVTADGTIVIADMTCNLYTVDPDTLTTTRIYSSGNEGNYYAAMTYDYNTGSIYWNPCAGAKTSPLYLVLLEESQWDPSRIEANVMDIGDVSTKYGVQQTVMFAIPENEPEAKIIPVEGVEITDGESIVGLNGGSFTLSTVTTPTRPSHRTRTWTSSDENVVTVDKYGTLTYTGLGTATVTVSVSNKDEATYGGPYTDTIEVTVLASAGKMEAFLTLEEGGLGYYDFWVSMNDNDLGHATVGQSAISVYSLRTGTYYDGYFYAYNSRGEFLRIDEKDRMNYVTLGTVNLDTATEQVTGMAIDYTTGTLYGVTLPHPYSDQYGKLVTINMDNGQITEVATLDTYIYALSCDADGVLYGAGTINGNGQNGTKYGQHEDGVLYKIDKSTASCTELVTIPDSRIFTGDNYYGEMQYNSQMTYDFTTNRLYLNATSSTSYMKQACGIYMIQLGTETPTVYSLGGITYDTGRNTLREGSTYLGLLSCIPELDELPEGKVNGIIMGKNYGRVAVGETTTLNARVRPANVADASLSWSSSDPSVATVDGSGVVTALKAGVTTITATSNANSAYKASCQITVIELSGEQSIAYTAVVGEDAIYSFNPALPAQTAEKIGTVSGGVNGVTYGDGCLYYTVGGAGSTYLYRFDLNTKESVSLGQIYAWSDITGIAYDAENHLLYAVGGFYIFQYDIDKLDPNGFNYYTNYVMDSDYCQLSAIACVDGQIYYVGTGYSSSKTQLMRFSDKYLSNREVISYDLGINTDDGKTEMAYDSACGLFYITDVTDSLFEVTLTEDAGTWIVSTEPVDKVGAGLTITGLAIASVKKD